MLVILQFQSCPREFSWRLNRHMYCVWCIYSGIFCQTTELIIPLPYEPVTVKRILEWFVENIFFDIGIFSRTQCLNLSFMYNFLFSTHLASATGIFFVFQHRHWHWVPIERQHQPKGGIEPQKKEMLLQWKKRESGHKSRKSIVCKNLPICKSSNSELW